MGGHQLMGEWTSNFQDHGGFQSMVLGPFMGGDNPVRSYALGIYLLFKSLQI